MSIAKPNAMARPNAIAVCLTALLSASCAAGGADSPSRSPFASPTGTLSHPQGAAELVLRSETVGGFLPREMLLSSYPLVSIYGDGTVITEGPQIAIFPGPALPNLISTKITEAGLQRLLALAAGAGLLGPDAQYDATGIADAGTARFTVVAEGTRHSISAYALNESEDRGLAPAVAAQRARLRAYAARLGDLRASLGPEQVGAEASYRFASVRLYVQPGILGEGPAQPALDWPLATPLATFGESAQSGAGDGIRCGVASRAELETLRPLLLRASQATPWHSGGRVFSIRVRVLLPDESGCPGVE
jgi:hypothetical protein